MTSKSTRPGFTLIELLVVVSIIALLISILLPSMASARQQSNKTRCQTNLAGLAKAASIYAQEFEAFPMNGLLFPKPGGNNFTPTIGYGNGETDMQKWDLPYGKLWAYTSQNRKLYVCPMDTFERTYQQALLRNIHTGEITFVAGTAPTPTSDFKGYWSYTMNTTMNSEGQFRNNFRPRNMSRPANQPWTDPLKWVNIKVPSTFIYFVEEDVTSNFNDEVFDAPAYNGNDFLTNRHNFGGNVAFGDAHVEWFSATLFNKLASGTGGVSHYDAMTQSPYTRMFFPDNGEYAQPGM